MKTILKWLRLVNLQKVEIFQFIGLSIITTACYIFLPLTYTKIATNALFQNYHSTILWAFINFLIIILNIIINNISNKIITSFNTNRQLTISKNYSSKFANSVIELSEPLYESLCLLFKILGLTLSAATISLSLALYISVAIIVCFSLKHTLQLLKLKDNHLIIIIVDCTWHILTLIMILFNINLVRHQTISISVFLVIATFISNHLLKPEFNNNLNKALILVKSTLDSLDKQEPTVNKNQISTNTKKK